MQVEQAESQKNKRVSKVFLFDKEASMSQATEAAQLAAQLAKLAASLPDCLGVPTVLVPKQGHDRLMPVRKARMRKRTCPAPPQLVSTGIFPTGVLFFRIAVYRNIRNFPHLYFQFFETFPSNCCKFSQIE